MDSQLQQQNHQDPLTTAGHDSGYDNSEEQHHGEKKSIFNKIKDKAKKLKNTITKHGHGHDDTDHHDKNDEDEGEEETVVRGSPVYDSASGKLGGPDAILAQPRGSLERASEMPEDRQPSGQEVNPEKWSGKIGPPTGSEEDPFTPHPTSLPSPDPPNETKYPVSNLDGPDAISAQPRGNLERPSVVPEDRNSAPPQPLGQEVDQEQLKGKIEATSEMEEDPIAPAHPTTIIASPDPPNGTEYPVGNQGSGQDVNEEALKGIIGKSSGMVEDPNPRSPKRVGSVPSNFETEETDKGGNEAEEVSQIDHSFNKMGIREEDDTGLGYEPKTLDHNHPENLPRDTITGGNPSSRSSSNDDKISSSASATATADKASDAKDVMATNFGYSGNTPAASTEQHETGKSSGGATDYAYKITDTVTGTLAPVYDKVVDAGSAVMSKVQGSVSQPQVQSGSDTSSGIMSSETETLKPGEEDKDVKTHGFNRGSHEGETEKKSPEDRETERVPESVELPEQPSANVTADKGVTERLVDAMGMGSWFGGKGNAPEGSLGTSEK